jgi:glutamate-1-semialdehyde 2,1-aminomutase
MWRAKSTSITSAPGAPCCSVIGIRSWLKHSCGKPNTPSVSAPPRNSKWKWPSSSRPLFRPSNWHGHGDAFLARAGSGLATLGEPTSPGVPAEIARLTLDATFNDLPSVAACFANFPDQIAGIIVEPAVGNMGCVQPAPGFLEGLRSLCTQHGAVLIFDEVMTGFRVAFGGMTEVSGVKPDLVCLGKIIGAGLPVGAYGGRRDLMEHVAPLGAMYQAGTLSGNPLAMAAGLAQLRYISAHRATIYPKLERDGAALQSAVEAAARKRGLPVQVGRQGSMATVFFTDAPVRDWPTANRCDRARFARWFHHLLAAGFYFPPAQFEGYFHSAAHTEDDIARTADAMLRGLDHAFA